jgi:glycine cleavage system aminomethyltransferase T
MSEAVDIAAITRGARIRRSPFFEATQRYGCKSYTVMSQANNPYEVGLEWLVDLDKKGDFIGKEALRLIKIGGVKRKLVGVEISGEPVGFNMTRWTVRYANQPVGEVTSAIYSPRLEKNIGYAMLPLEHAELGTELTVDVPGRGGKAATVVRKPFVDPNKEIPKS